MSRLESDISANLCKRFPLDRTREEGGPPGSIYEEFPGW
jgi:hypothetical protein